MTLKHFETELDRQGVTKIVNVTTTVSMESVAHASRPARSTQASFVMKPDAEWTWRDLRDYVVGEIESRFGGMGERNLAKESGIFKSFLARWEGQAVPIARYAFETADGKWMDQPIGITRFCKGSDPYFAEKIVPLIGQTSIGYW